MAVEVKLEGTCAVVLGIYRPPRSKGANYYQVLEEELNEITSWAISKCQTIIITGDLNLDRLKPNEREGKPLTDLEKVFELTCLIDQATRVTTTSSTLLDVILTNTPDLFKSAGVAEMGLSDHKLVYTFVNKVVKQHAARIINCRSTKHLDLQEFKKDLNDTEWLEDPSVPVNEQYTHWKTKLTKIMDKHLPVRKMRVRKSDVPYMNAEWKAAIRKKRKYAKKFSKDRNSETWELMKKWRNQATRLRRRAIKDYWKGISCNLNDNPRKFFGIFCLYHVKEQ